MLKKLFVNKRGADTFENLEGGLYASVLAIVAIALLNYFVPLSQYAGGKLSLGVLGQFLLSGIIASALVMSLRTNVFGGKINWTSFVITLVFVFVGSYLVWFTWPKTAPLGLFDEQTFYSFKLGVQSMIGVLP